MARIPDGVIERLKTDVSVQRLAEARGVVFTRHGADLIGRCPFHEDKTPSLVVTPAKNLWHCLGACQIGGTVKGDAVADRDGEDTLALPGGEHLVYPDARGSDHAGQVCLSETDGDPQTAVTVRHSVFMREAE